MAKPNYSFEKRQRELDKKKKKEEKLKEREMRKTVSGSDGAQGGVEPQKGADANRIDADAGIKPAP
jgi:hypothetical protein